MKMILASLALALTSATSFAGEEQSVDTGSPQFQTTVFGVSVNPDSAINLVESKAGVYVAACDIAKGVSQVTTVETRMVPQSRGRSGYVTGYQATAKVTCSNFDADLFKEAIEANKPDVNTGRSRGGR